MTLPQRPRSRDEAVDVESARRLAHRTVVPLTAESVDLADAVGRVLYRDMVAAQDIPHYASSAMDGWAVCGDPPWTLLSDAAELRAGQAVPIVTGGAIPSGAERVLRSERARRVEGWLEPDARWEPCRDGLDIRPRGDEARAGDVLVGVGTRLNPAHIAVAASCALDRVEVSARPRVALVLTGDEVTESGAPGPGKVRDSFGPQLPALIAMLGGIVVSAERVPDRLAGTIDALAAADAELVITTGGTGHSPADHVRGALRELGAELLITRLAARPGSPTLLARLPDGRIIVGLPGNPLAAICGLLVLAAPLLEAWTGRPLSDPIPATTSRDVAGHAGSTSLIPYRDVDGGAVPSAWTGSGMMRGLAESTGLLLVPPSGLRAGTRTSALPVPWLTGP
jgi:molybdopterin molybdotransferase